MTKILKAEEFVNEQMAKVSDEYRYNIGDDLREQIYDISKWFDEYMPETRDTLKHLIIVMGKDSSKMFKDTMSLSDYDDGAEYRSYDGNNATLEELVNYMTISNTANTEPYIGGLRVFYNTRGLFNTDEKIDFWKSFLSLKGKQDGVVKLDENSPYNGMAIKDCVVVICVGSFRDLGSNMGALAPFKNNIYRIYNNK